MKFVSIGAQEMPGLQTGLKVFRNALKTDRVWWLMRSLTVLLCFVAGLACVWLQYLKPYEPPEGAPSFRERFRALYCLSLGGLSLFFSFVYLLCDLNWSLPIYARLGAVVMAAAFNVLTALILFGIFPPRPID